MNTPAHMVDYTSKHEGANVAHVTKSVYDCLGEAPRRESDLAWIITFLLL